MQKRIAGCYLHPYTETIIWENIANAANTANPARVFIPKHANIANVVNNS